MSTATKTQQLVMCSYETPRGKMYLVSTRGWNTEVTAWSDDQGRLRIEQSIMAQTCVASFLQQYNVSDPGALRQCIEGTLRELVPAGPFFQLMADQNSDSNLIRALKIGTHVVLGCRFCIQDQGRYLQQKIPEAQSRGMFQKIIKQIKCFLSGQPEKSCAPENQKLIQGYPAIVWDGERLKLTLITAEEIFQAVESEFEDIFIFEVRSV